MAQAVVRQERRGTVAVLVIDAPPVNALGHALRRALWQAIEAADADPDISAIVIGASGRTFPAGADITEFDRAAEPPGLSALCDRIEACGKPVVAALFGTALGGGLEVALAAHGRVALASTRVGLPEVTLGVLPGAGGTQRLPRLIGADQALRLMLSGTPVGAAEALALGLLDTVVEDGLEAAALSLAADLAARPLRRTRDRQEGMRDGIAYHRAVAIARDGVAGHRLPGPARIVDCVEAAQLLSFDQGLAFEAAAFADLVATEEAAGLRHAFFAERRASRFPEAAEGPEPEVKRLGILGALAAELALPALRAGLSLVVVEPNRPRLVAALERIATAQEQAVAEGQMTPEGRDAEWARLTPALGAAALAECDIVLVADPELLAEAVEVTPEGVPLALLGKRSGHRAGRAGDMFGFRPAGGRLIEILPGPETSGAAIRAGLVLARRLGLQPLRAGAPGGIAARVTGQGNLAVRHMLGQGDTPEVIAAALHHYGLGALVPPPAPAALPRIAPAEAARIGLRVIAAMANEGARLVGQGVALRPSDVDYAVVASRVFPRWLGGPMHWADRRGLLILRRDLALWEQEAPALWTAAPLLLELAATGGHFADLNG